MYALIIKKISVKKCKMNRKSPGLQVKDSLTSINVGITWQEENNGNKNKQITPSLHAEIHFVHKTAFSLCFFFVFKHCLL